MPKILIADDLPFLRLLIEECLEDVAEQGVQILVAENGKEALDLIVQQKPELVFLDVMMPIMNGYEVCEQVKNEPALKGVHIVMLTAKGQESDMAKGHEVGADSYLTKPFNPLDIGKIARRVLHLSSGE